MLTDHHRYFVYVGGKIQVIYESGSDGSAETSYLHYDSLGSVDTVTGATGEVKARFAYKPFGEKLKLDKNGLLTQAPAKTNRGYTGHETIESTGYINMNARLYDPTIGRFLSADTIIPAVYDTQAYNRYSYVRNNPMKYTDPSGRSWFSSALGSVGNFFKKHWRTIVTIAVVAAVVALTGGLGAGLACAIIQGAIAGFTGGFVGTLLYGGDFNAAISNGLRGALVGGISGGVAHGVVGLTAATTGVEASAAHSASFFESFSSGSGWGVATFKALAHGISRAAIAQAQGQNATSGFWSGFVASGFSVGNEGYGGFVPRTMMMAVAGGTVSQMTGGKFANGAVSAAFVHMFNAEARRWISPTGQGIRSDRRGDGHFGSSRDGGSRLHSGVDYTAENGQDIVAVTSGTITKIGYTYSDDLSFRYVEIQTNDGYAVREYYVSPGDGIAVGVTIDVGQNIGTAQDLTGRYPGITNHVHVEVRHDGQLVNPSDYI